jgi:hypothetical protein
LQFVVAGMIERREFRAQRRSEGLVCVGEQSRSTRCKVGDYAVDPVEAGAGHQPDVTIGH